MAFRASNVIDAQALDRAKNLCVNIKSQAQQASNSFSSGATGSAVLRLYENILNARAELDSLKNTPGIADYARARENDETYDVVTEFNAVLAALDSAISAVRSSFPTDASGFILNRQFASGTNNYVERNFTGAQLSGIRSELDAVAASIE